MTPPLIIRALKVRSVSVPVDPPLETSAGPFTVAPLVLLDLETAQGVTGRAYIFAYTPVAVAPVAQATTNLAPLVIGQKLAPVAVSQLLAGRFRLVGTDGLLAMALALIDMAAWDALARAAEMPLARFLGGGGDERIPAYKSLRAWEAKALGDEAGKAVDQGFRAVKLKFGHPTLGAERNVYRTVRSAVGEDVDILVDPNQAFSVPEAIYRASHYAEWGIRWLEEPVRSDDLAGHAAVARAAPSLPIQRGENDWNAPDVAASIAAGASSLIMLDAMKIGGVTGWREASGVCSAASVPVSSHLFIEISAHLLAATVGRDRLEWLDLARPILREGSPQFEDGCAIPSPGPGIGLEWDEEVVARYTG